MREQTALSNYYNIVWNYFELHAKQRLTTFRYYLIMLTLLVTGIAFIYAEHKELLVYAQFFSGFLVLISILFLLLDRRNIKFYKKAIYNLKTYEDYLQNTFPIGNFQVRNVFTSHYLATECKISYTIIFFVLYILVCLASAAFLLFTIICIN